MASVAQAAQGAQAAQAAEEVALVQGSGQSLAQATAALRLAAPG